MADRKEELSNPRGPEVALPGAVGGGDSESSASIVYNYFIQSASNVQVGDGNTMVFEEAQSLLQKEDKQMGLGKKEILIALINSILNPNFVPNPPAMKVRDVELAFKSCYSAAKGTTEKSSFSDVYGLSLKTFFESDCTRYALSTEKGVLKVKLKSSKKKKKKKGKKSGAGAEDPKPPTGELGDTSTALEAEQGAGASSDTTGPEWTVIPSREEKKKQKQEDKTSKEVQEEPVVAATKRSISQEQTEALIRELLTKPEGDQLIIHPDDSPYKDSRGKFMVDLVSLWNTPHRVRSHILLGAATRDQPPHTIVGLHSPMSQDFYRSLFLGDHFTMVPTFSYSECLLDGGKIIGVIEVGGSFGCGSPAIPCKDDEDGWFRADELWIRSGRENYLCRARDPRTTLIHQWFGGASAAATSSQHRAVEELVPRPVEPLQGARGAGDAGSGAGCGKRTEAADGDFVEAVKRFRKGHFCLVTGDTGLPGRQLQALAAVDWLSILDFDPLSRDSGLLGHIEDVINKRRSLRLCTWQDTLGGLTESGIQWVFLRGLRGVPVTHVPDDPSQWQRLTRDFVHALCRQLARFAIDYTVLTLVVLWPQDTNTARCVKAFLAKISEVIDSPPPSIVLCSPGEPRDQRALTAFRSLLDDCADHLQWVKVDSSQVCSLIDTSTSGGGASSAQTVPFILPAGEGEEECVVSERDAAWLREDLEVLYRESPYTRAVDDVEALKTEQENFFRGGTLHWFAWYDLKPNHLDVERDILGKVLPFIRKEHLALCKGGVVKLFHAPGSGGTTLAQRVLWELRGEAPCAQVKQRSGSSFEELVSRILFLHERTHLPVVLLLDGVEESRLSQLSRYLTRSQAVLVYVRRYPYRIQEPCSREKESAFFLQGTVSAQEATRLAVLFSNRCTEERKQRELKRLSKEAKEGGRQHYLYEFGMTVFHQGFRGVEAHVRGYLQLDRNPSSEDLLPWQRALGFLALVHFYSQSSIPVQFFAALFGKPSNYCMALDDFQYPVSVFIVPDRNEGRANQVRICHYIVSKELLEQLLKPGGGPRTGDKERLSREARRNLRKFCFSFINQACSRKVKASISSLTIKNILTRTFIFRDNRDVGEDELQSKKRSMFSQIMYDMDSEPPYSEREAVLKKLTDAFPDDPNFHAHLGRFYAICRPEMEEVAERCLKKALDLCQDDAQRRRQDPDENMKLTLMHIHHMYGIIFQRRISKFTGRSFDDQPEIRIKRGDYERVAGEVIHNALQACENFRLSRENTPLGEEKCYAFGSEIHVRLQVCDFISRHHSGGIAAILARAPTVTNPLFRFVQESLTAIEDLVLECYSLIGPDGPEGNFQKFTLWYSHLFKDQVPEVDIRDCGDDISMRRLAIAASKLKYSRNGGSSTMDSVTSREDLNFFVSEYERIFTLARRTGKFSRRCLELDHREWLAAIRNPRFEKTYKVEYVLSVVRRWNDMVQSPTSKFYVFVLSSLLGFGSGEAAQQGNSESLVEAQISQQEMVKVNQTVLNPRRPREWLGRDSSGIRVLVPSSRIGHTVLRDLPGHVSSLLAVCKGSICHPNKKKLAGHINLDLGTHSVVPVQVFFIPLVAELEGPRYAHHRVQFWLAFSLEHGYEAFGVRLLHKYTCTSCGDKTEITSEEDSVACKCGDRVVKSDDVLDGGPS